MSPQDQKTSKSKEESDFKSTQEYYDRWLNIYKATLGRFVETPAVGPAREKSEKMMKGLSTFVNLYAAGMDISSNLQTVFAQAMRKVQEKTANDMEGEISPEKYKEFCKKFNHIPHAGVGYFFKAYSEGFSWHPLLESNKGNAHFVFISSIYDDLIFHLNTAAYAENEPIVNPRFIQIRKWGWRYFWVHVLRIILLSKTQQQLLGAKRFIVPRHLIGQGWKHVGFPMFYKPIHWHERTQLLENPESYLNYLRTGKRQK